MPSLTKKLSRAFACLSAFCCLIPTLSGCGGESDETPTPAAPSIMEQADVFTDDDFLTASGTSLVNAKGERVHLKGTNLGGWLHLEGWMDGGGGVREDVWGNHHAALTALKARFTPDQVEALLEIYQNAYIQESDLRYIQSLGLNLVRVPFFWTEILDEEGNVRPHAFNQLDWLVARCKKLGIYVMLDLHGAPGGHSGGWTTGGHNDSNELWTNETYQAWAVRIWETLATHFQNEPTVCGYDLLNEPVTPADSDGTFDDPTSPDIVPLTRIQMYDKLYRAVRAIDEKHICVMGAFFNFDSLDDPHTLGWENVVYQTHHYDDGNKAHDNQNIFACSQASYIAEYQQKWQVPVFAGEFNFWTAKEAWNTWLTTLERNDVSWATWTYKNTATDESLNWGLYHLPQTVEFIDYERDSYDEIARKWRTFSSENYTQNEFLKGVFTHATAPKHTALTSAEIATFYTGGQGENVRAMFDGDLFSESGRWSYGAKQTDDGSQFIQLQFKQAQTLDCVEIYSHGFDFTTKYRLSALVGGRWVTLASGTGNAGCLVIPFEAVTAEGLRIQQTGKSDFWWSINELYLYPVQ